VLLTVCPCLRWYASGSSPTGSGCGPGTLANPPGALDGRTSLCGTCPPLPDRRRGARESWRRVWP